MDQPLIRVLVVDDHPVLRAGLAQLLSGAGDIDVVGLGGDGAEAISLRPGAAPRTWC